MVPKQSGHFAVHLEIKAALEKLRQIKHCLASPRGSYFGSALVSYQQFMGQFMVWFKHKKFRRGSLPYGQSVCSVCMCTMHEGIGGLARKVECPPFSLAANAACATHYFPGLKGIQPFLASSLPISCPIEGRHSWR